MSVLHDTYADSPCRYFYYGLFCRLQAAGRLPFSLCESLRILHRRTSQGCGYCTASSAEQQVLSCVADGSEPDGERSEARFHGFTGSKKLSCPVVQSRHQTDAGTTYNSNHLVPPSKITYVFRTNIIRKGTCSHGFSSRRMVAHIAVVIAGFNAHNTSPTLRDV